MKLRQARKILGNVKSWPRYSDEMFVRAVQKWIKASRKESK